MANCPPANLSSSGTKSEIKRMTDFEKFGFTLSSQQNKNFQFLMAGILRVIWPAANDVATTVVNGRIGYKTCCKCGRCAPVETSAEGVCCLEILEICKPRFSSTSCLNVCRLDPHFEL